MSEDTTAKLVSTAKFLSTVVKPMSMSLVQHGLRHSVVNDEVDGGEEGEHCAWPLCDEGPNWLLYEGPNGRRLLCEARLRAQNGPLLCEGPKRALATLCEGPKRALASGHTV